MDRFAAIFLILEVTWRKPGDCYKKNRLTGYSPSQVSRSTCSLEFHRRYTAALEAFQRDAIRRSLLGCDG